MRIEYAVGLGFEEGEEETARMYAELTSLGDYDVAKCELLAHLLLMAVRLEWRRIDQLHEAARDSERRRQRAAARKAAKAAT